MQSFLGYKLSATERDHLLQLFPPQYPSIKADHITIQLARPEILPQASNIALLGMADDGIGCEAFVVSIDGQRTRPDGLLYHLTWSFNPDIDAPAAYDLWGNASSPYRAYHSSGMITQLEQQGRINWFDTPLLLPARQAVFDDRTGQNHSVLPTSNLLNPRHTQDIG